MVCSKQSDPGHDHILNKLHNIQHTNKWNIKYLWIFQMACFTNGYCASYFKFKQMLFYVNENHATLKQEPLPD